LLGTLGSQGACIPAAVVQAWLPDSNLNDGLLIANEVETNGINIASSESTNVSDHPKLMVVYQ